MRDCGNATGVYYKVVDSDDWVNEEAYMEVLDTLRRFVHGQCDAGYADYQLRL